MGTGTNILLIEDDPATRETMTQLLEEEGYTVACAHHGRAALDHLATGERPRLILLDLMMPVMDGREFRRRQLEEPALASIPVILLSATAAPGEAASLGVAGQFRKPVAFAALLQAIRRQTGH